MYFSRKSSPIKNVTLSLTTSTVNVMTFFFLISMRMFVQPNEVCLSFPNFYLSLFFFVLNLKHIWLQYPRALVRPIRVVCAPVSIYAPSQWWESFKQIFPFIVKYKMGVFFCRTRVFGTVSKILFGKAMVYFKYNIHFQIQLLSNVVIQQWFAHFQILLLHYLKYHYRYHHCVGLIVVMSRIRFD